MASPQRGRNRMSSSKSEYVIAEINEGSSVTEMISLLRGSFRRRDFDEVERLLKLREDRMLNDLNNLRRDFDSLRKEHDSLAQDYGISELNRLTVEEELKKYKSDFEESRKQMKRFKVAYECVQEELKKVETEKAEGNQMIEKLISEKHEAEETAQLLHGHLENFVSRVSILEGNVGKLLNVDAGHIRRGDNCQELALDVKGIFPISSPAKRSLSKVMDSSCKGESGGSEVENLHNRVNCGFVVEKRNGSKDYPDKTPPGTLSIGIGDLHDSHHCHSPHNVCGTENLDFPLEGNEHDNGETIVHAQLTSDHPLAETDGFDQEKVSAAGAITSTNVSSSNEMGVQKLTVDAGSTEAIGSFIPNTDQLFSPIIVEISDGEDENDAAESSDVSAFRAKKVNPIGNKMSIRQKNGSGYFYDSCIDLTRKRKRSKTGPYSDNIDSLKVAGGKTTDSALRCDDGLKPVNYQQFTLPSINRHLAGAQCQRKAAPNWSQVHDNYDSSDSEDASCFESYMENKVAKFKRYNQNSWKCAADMCSAFQKDYELCMNAVCALYRKKMSSKALNFNPSAPGDIIFFHFDAMRGKALAEYLIDGNPLNKMKKTLLEVQQEAPKVVSQCKDLAMHYSEKLFDMYTEGGDRFFRPDL